MRLPIIIIASLATAAALAEPASPTAAPDVAETAPAAASPSPAPAPAIPAPATPIAAAPATPAVLGLPTPDAGAPAPADKQAGAAPARPAETAAAPPEAKGSPPTRAALRLRVRAAALKAGLPGEIADAVAQVESSYNAAAVGGVGEVGLMQVLPTTAHMLGFRGTNAELAEPETNIRYGVSYLSEAWRLADKDVCTTVMKYRAGHGETRFSHRSVDYCVRVRAILAAQGFALTGEVPKATFGDAVTAGRGAARGAGSVARGRARSRINWAAADARMKAITGKVTSASLSIAR